MLSNIQRQPPRRAGTRRVPAGPWQAALAPHPCAPDGVGSISPGVPQGSPVSQELLRQTRRWVSFLYGGCSSSRPPAHLPSGFSPAGELLLRGPVFVREPSSSMVPVGLEDRRVTLNCEARGNPSPHYRYSAETEAQVGNRVVGAGN